MELSAALRKRRFENGYVIICGIFAVLMVLTNIIGTKLFAFFPSLFPTGFGFLSGYGPVILTTGLVTYPLTFLFTDICSEVYGRRRANVMVTIGFLASILMLLVVNIAVSVTPADRFWNGGAAGVRTHGCEVLAVEGQTLQIDHAEFLSLPDGEKPVMIGVLSKDKTLEFVTYFKLEETGGNFGEKYREAHITLHAGEVKEGDTLLPAVQLIEFQKEEDQPTRIRIAGGSDIPVKGTLKDANGVQINYVREANGEWLQVANYPADASTSSRPAAVINVMGPVEMQQAMDVTFASPAILLGASMLAYLVAQYLDVFMYHFWKNVTNGKKMWLRNNGSTWVSQLVDTILVNGIFLPWAFHMGFMDTLYVIICVYIVKVLLAALDTPLIYLGVYIEKRRLGYKWEDDVPDLLAHEEDEAAKA